jgi:trehalose-6-phosphate synthase
MLLLLLQANDRFGEVVLNCYQPGDMVWVQDYHLMLLPSILKNAVPRIKVRAQTLHCICCYTDDVTSMFRHAACLLGCNSLG